MAEIVISGWWVTHWVSALRASSATYWARMVSDPQWVASATQRAGLDVNLSRCDKAFACAHFLHLNLPQTGLWLTTLSFRTTANSLSISGTPTPRRPTTWICRYKQFTPEFPEFRNLQRLGCQLNFESKSLINLPKQSSSEGGYSSEADLPKLWARNEFFEMLLLISFQSLLVQNFMVSSSTMRHSLPPTTMHWEGRSRLCLGDNRIGGGAEGWVDTGWAIGGLLGDYHTSDCEGGSGPSHWSPSLGPIWLSVVHLCQYFRPHNWWNLVGNSIRWMSTIADKPGKIHQLDWHDDSMYIAPWASTPMTCVVNLRLSFCKRCATLQHIVSVLHKDKSGHSLPKNSQYPREIPRAKPVINLKGCFLQHHVGQLCYVQIQPKLLIQIKSGTISTIQWETKKSRIS